MNIIYSHIQHILIESQWNLNDNGGSEDAIKVININRITVEFKFIYAVFGLF